VFTASISSGSEWRATNRAFPGLRAAGISVNESTASTKPAVVDPGGHDQQYKDRH
jgi:hypothetical protein